MPPSFKVSVEINKPIDSVFRLFLDKSAFSHWKKDYLGYEHLSGTPGMVDSVTRLKYKRQVMIERIVSLDQPQKMVASYEHQQGGKTNMYHTVTNRFIAVGADKTRVEVSSEITKINGLLMKILISLMAGAGKKYAQTQLNQLKVYAEKAL